MWIYEQATGRLNRKTCSDCRGFGCSISQGYSGHGPGLNNPALQHIRAVGPIPCGTWLIGEPFDSETRGPFVLPLSPGFGTQTFERTGFLIHGDERALPGKPPGQASHGCIVLSRDVRKKIWDSNDHVLEVM